MNRVEKYRDYRREIMEMRDDQENTKILQSSNKVDELLKKDNSTKKLQYDDIKDGLGIYDFSTENSITSPNYYKKKLALFYIVMGMIILILLAATIVTGILAFGGK